MEDILKDASERYSIDPAYLNEITIYQSSTANNEQFNVDYLFSSYEDGMVYSSVYRGKKEFVIVGNHTLTEEGNILYEKITGEN